MLSQSGVQPLFPGHIEATDDDGFVKIGTLNVNDPGGLHLSPSAQLQRLFGYEEDVYLRLGSVRSAISAISLIGLQAKQGSKLDVEVTPEVQYRINGSSNKLIERMQAVLDDQTYWHKAQ